MENNLNSDNKNVELLNNDESAKPANKKATIFNCILVAVIFVGLFIYMVLVDGLDNIVNLLKINVSGITSDIPCTKIHK